MAQTLSSLALATSSLTVTSEVVMTYAELTDDFNPLHVDAEFAATTPMGRQIAHGTTSLCLIWQCLQRNFGGAALSSVDLDVRFVKPVYIGDVVTAGGEPSAEQPGLWSVWVRGGDGTDRIVGTFSLRSPGDTIQGASNGRN